MSGEMGGGRRARISHVRACPRSRCGAWSGGAAPRRGGGAEGSESTSDSRSEEGVGSESMPPIAIEQVDAYATLKSQEVR